MEMNYKSWIPNDGERYIYFVASRVAEDFACQGGPMDRLGFRWIQSLLRKPCKHLLHYVDEDAGFSVHVYPTGQYHRPTDFYTIGEFLDEPTGEVIYREDSEYHQIAEIWDDRFSECYLSELYQWLDEQQLSNSIIFSGPHFSEAFLQALVAFDACEVAWLERFGSYPFKHLFLRCIK